MVKIYVGNISKTARRDELKAMFEKFGTVVECDILREFGFVHMDNAQDAEEAVRSLHGTSFCGNVMRVELSNTARKRESGSSSSARHRERDRSPIRQRDFRDRDYYGRDRDFDSYRGYAPPPPPPPPQALTSNGIGSPAFFSMLAAAAANVHDQLRNSSTGYDSMEVYNRMYHALTGASASFSNGGGHHSSSNNGPPPAGGLPSLLSSGGYSNRPSPPNYSGSRFGGGGGGGDVYGNSSGGGYDSSFDRRRY